MEMRIRPLTLFPPNLGRHPVIPRITDHRKLISKRKVETLPDYSLISRARSMSSLIGMRNQNVDPLPTSESTHSLPKCTVSTR